MNSWENGIIKSNPIVRINLLTVPTLYLVTDHTCFYERYGWKFLCMVQGDGESDMARMYIHRA